MHEYKRIKEEIPSVLQPPMKPFCDRVEEALLPGVTALTWTALNVDTCKNRQMFKHDLNYMAIFSVRICLIMKIFLSRFIARIHVDVSVSFTCTSVLLDGRLRNIHEPIL